MEEIWKIVVKDYEVSNFGNIRRGGCEIKGSIMNSGYRYFQLQENGKRKNYLIHQLVAYNFIGERPDKFDIDHIDRNKLNNNVSNLRYISHKENSQNHHLYREDIKQQDPLKRKSILGFQSRRKSGKVKGTQRTKGEGHLYQRETGNWRAVIIINKKKYDKTFKTKEEAEKFLNDLKPEKPYLW